MCARARVCVDVWRKSGRNTHTHTHTHTHTCKAAVGNFLPYTPHLRKNLRSCAHSHSILNTHTHTHTHTHTCLSLPSLFLYLIFLSSFPPHPPPFPPTPPTPHTLPTHSPLRPNRLPLLSFQKPFDSFPPLVIALYVLQPQPTHCLT